MSDKMTAVAEAIKRRRYNEERREFFYGDEFWTAVSGFEGAELAQVVLECPEAFSRYNVEEHHIDFSKITAQDWIMLLARHPGLARALKWMSETSKWSQKVRLADSEFAKDAKWKYSVHAGRAYIHGMMGCVRTERDKKWSRGWALRQGEKEWHFLTDSLLRLWVIKVPAYIDGIPVYSVGQDTFEDCLNTRKVIISEGVVEVDSFMFWGGGNPHEVILPSTLKYIRPYAFDRCPWLKEQIIPEGCVSIGSYAFSGCSRLKRVRIPKTVKRIGDHAFESCEQLEEIILESEDCEFGEGILLGCTSLRSVVGPLGPRLEDLNAKWRLVRRVGWDELKDAVLTFVTQAVPNESDGTDVKILKWFQNEAKEQIGMDDDEEAKVKELQLWIGNEFRKHGFVA